MKEGVYDRMTAYSCIRLNGELVDYEPPVEENESSLCLDKETLDYYQSLLELGAGIWTPGELEPTETLKESVSSHQATKTFKKTKKKRSMEQRSKSKKVNRIDVVHELEVEEAIDWKDILQAYQ